MFFFNYTTTTEIYTLSLHDALPISDSPDGTLSFCCCELTGGGCPDESQGFHFDRASDRGRDHRHFGRDRDSEVRQHEGKGLSRVDEVGPPEPRDGRRGLLRRFGEVHDEPGYGVLDRKSRRLNSSHYLIS